MPTFWQRPLTWLFLMATACIDAVGFSADPEAAWVDGFVLGQLIVVGAWFALGRSHRLARAATLIAVIGAFTLPDFLADHRGGFIITGPYLLGAVVVLSVSAAALTWGWQMLGRAAFGRAKPASSPSWRYPVAEILGWMTIVAVAVAAMQRAEFQFLLEMGREAGFAYASVAAITLVVVLSIGDIRKTAWPNGIVESAWLVLLATAVFVAPAVQSSGPTPRSVDPVNLIACLYVGTWVITQLLESESPARGPSSSLHAAQSRDE